MSDQARTSQIAVFGSGCFWCTEAIYNRLNGIISVEPGYAGGQTDNPSYDQVCSGQTGHAEVTKVEFDPSIISYSQLLDVFFHTHNPTTPNQQGADRGTQYRSIILTTTQDQSSEAGRALAAFNHEGIYQSEAVTQIEPLQAFYSAEDYHQRYYERNGNAPYCQVIINPKLQKFRQHYATLLKLD